MIDSKSCLLIVDVQNGFINEWTKHVPSLVEAAQMDYDYVVATRFFNPERSFFRSLIKWDRFSVGSDDIPLAFNVRKDALIIDKPLYTCVTEEFIRWLKERYISVVHVCGIDTDICVTKCAVDLFERGVEPVVLGGLCASYAGEEAHRNALSTLERYIGESQVRW
jgi:nicotinamidase-related amidase